MRARLAGLAVLSVAALIAILVTVADGDGDAPRPDAYVTVGGRVSAPPIPAGFVGVSMEYTSAAAVAGPSGDPDVAVQRLLAALAPGQSPVLRIGGDSTDHAWWPAPGLHDPDRSAYALSPAWVASIRTLAQALHARMVLGINLEADNPRLAAVEARALVGGIGRSSVQALEIGNEANLYPSLSWYKTRAGVRVFGRPEPYSPQQYLSDISRFSRALPPLRLAGPALGAPIYMSHVLGRLLASEPRLTEITFHRYPLNRCFTRPSMPTFPTIPNLMAKVSSTGLAETVTGFAKAARARGDAFRVDELNSVACSGKRGISNTFASALWMLDTLFAMARVGVSGVNIHTLPSAAYRLFTVHHTSGRWSVTVAPVYYGLLAFTRAAPPGSHLLHVGVRGPSTLRAWATSSRQSTRVALINESPVHARTVAVQVPPGSAASVERLRAPSLRATSGVSLGGRSFASPTADGELPGPPGSTPAPRDAHGYVVKLPPASAALLTVTR